MVTRQEYEARVKVARRMLDDERRRMERESDIATIVAILLMAALLAAVALTVGLAWRGWGR